MQAASIAVRFCCPMLLGSAAMDAAMNTQYLQNIKLILYWYGHAADQE